MILTNEQEYQLATTIYLQTEENLDCRFKGVFLSMHFGKPKVNFCGGKKKFLAFQTIPELHLSNAFPKIVPTVFHLHV